nr:MAG TPA: hemagglutinin [Caudoviricetes sp.]
METQDLNEIIKQQNEIIAVKDSKIGILEERIGELNKKIMDLSDEVFWLEYEKSESKGSYDWFGLVMFIVALGAVMVMVMSCR